MAAEMRVGGCTWVGGGGGGGRGGRALHATGGVLHRNEGLRHYVELLQAVWVLRILYVPNVLQEQKCALQIAHVGV